MNRRGILQGAVDIIFMLLLTLTIVLFAVLFLFTTSDIEDQTIKNGIHWEVGWMANAFLYRPIPLVDENGEDAGVLLIQNLPSREPSTIDRNRLRTSVREFLIPERIEGKDPEKRRDVGLLLIQGNELLVDVTGLRLEESNPDEENIFEAAFGVSPETFVEEGRINDLITALEARGSVGVAQAHGNYPITIITVGFT